MNRSSIFKRKIDFQKSFGSYLVDKDTQEEYLDFFGQYSTLALGYNHSIFKTNSYRNDIKNIAHQKITNCEILSDESAEFDELFRSFTSNGIFTHYHYCCTGALAIESAIKTAMDYKGEGHHRVINFKGSFHGINSYGGILTDRFEPVKQRLMGFPGSYWEPMDNPIIQYRDGEQVVNYDLLDQVLNDIENIIVQEKNICAILVEPIQCTYGDQYFPNLFFERIRELATNYDIPLIFDEIQVGFGISGKLWFFENLSIVPDILVFGKKTQLSGIAVAEKFATIFNNAIRLEVTWDADIIDMIRCKYIIKVFQKYQLLENVNSMAKKLKEGLGSIEAINNIRNSGLLFAFDFQSADIRNAFVNKLISHRMLCNPTRGKTIRLRPNLCVNKKEIEHALNIISKVCSKI